MTRLTVVSDIPQADGWYPILHMQRLLANLLGADFYDISATSTGRFRAFLNTLSLKQRSSDNHVGIFIVRTAYDAHKFIPVERALGGFSQSIIWIIDSFWTEAAVRHRRLIDRHFDFVAYTQAFDSAIYDKLFGRRALCLEWGSDVLELGGAGANREMDLLRVGRQPAAWENDAETNQSCASRGLRFGGRPPSDAKEVSTLMRQYYGHAKFVLAHSNAVATASYTHPTKGYITARWTDALASGATVAGSPPANDLVLLDWPEALLVASHDDREAGLDCIASAAASWTPDVARRNHLGALRRLDWRWRYRTLATVLQIDAPRLHQSLSVLEARIASLTSGL